MNKFLNTLLFITLALFLSNTWGANKESTNGGKGSLVSNAFNNCFQVDSGAVKEICASYTINWKMWSLMGEPVGDYNLSWQLTSIKLMDPQRRLVSIYSPDQIPSPLKKGVAAIELYIDAYATIMSNIDYVDHRFNTGVAVRANAGSSFNVPGSPSWDKLFIRTGNPCEDSRQYLDAQSAKTLFNKGIKLGQFHICPTSNVSELTSLKNAIGKMCDEKGADQIYNFCPEQKEKKVKNGKQYNNYPMDCSPDPDFNPLDDYEENKIVNKNTTTFKNEASETKKKYEEARDKLDQEVIRVSQVLKEFKAGEYCSGCYQTKSEILAKGETFPHPGRSIIIREPSWEEIKSKENELNKNIPSLQSNADSLKRIYERSLNNYNSKIEEVKAERSKFSKPKCNANEKVEKKSPDSNQNKPVNFLD